MANMFQRRFIPITLGVSGHIDIDEKDFERARIEFLLILEALKSGFSHSPVQLLVSLAVGADRIAAQSFIKFREDLDKINKELARQWELIVILPMDVDLFKRDFPESVNEFQAIIDKADAIVTMPLQSISTARDIIQNGEERNLQYQASTRYISMHSDILVVFWDGKNPNRIGGTYDAIRMRLFGHAVTDAIHYSPLANSASNFVLQIRVSRKTKTEFEEVETRFASHKMFKSSINSLIEDFYDGRDINEFNKSVFTKITHQKFLQSIKYLCEAETFEKIMRQKLNYSEKFVMELYATADALSIFSEKKWSLLTATIYSLGLGTSVLLPIAIENLFFPWTMLGYIVMLSFAFGIYSWIQITKLENKHVESRALAEFLRVQIAWLHARPASITQIERYQDFLVIAPRAVSTALLGQQLINIGWLGRVLTSLIILPDQKHEFSDKDIHSEFVADWIDGQMQYFKKSHLRAEKAAHKISILSKAFVFGGLLSAFCAIAMPHLDLHEKTLHHILIIGAASLPIMSVILENFAENFAYEAKSKINKRLQNVFESAHKLMRDSDTPQSIKDSVVIEAGKESVSEAVTWFFLRRSKPTKVAM